MSRTRIVLRQQDVTRTDGEALATACLEFQRAAERDDKARHRILVPLIGSAGFGLLEGQTDAAEHVAQKVASYAPGKIDCSFLIMRLAIVAGPQSHTPDHDVFLSVRHRAAVAAVAGREIDEQTLSLRAQSGTYIRLSNRHQLRRGQAPFPNPDFEALRSGRPSERPRRYKAVLRDRNGAIRSSRHVSPARR